MDKGPEELATRDRQAQRDIARLELEERMAKKDKRGADRRSGDLPDAKPAWRRADGTMCIVALAVIGDKTRHLAFTAAAKFRNPPPDLDRHSRHGAGEPVTCRCEGSQRRIYD